LALVSFPLFEPKNKRAHNAVNLLSHSSDGKIASRKACRPVTIPTGRMGVQKPGKWTGLEEIEVYWQYFAQNWLYFPLSLSFVKSLNNVEGGNRRERVMMMEEESEEKQGAHECGRWQKHWRIGGEYWNKRIKHTRLKQSVNGTKMKWKPNRKRHGH